MITTVNKLLRSSKLFNRRQSGSLVRRFQLLLLMWGLFVYFIAVCGFWFVSTSLIETMLERQAAQWLEKIDTLSMPLYVSSNESSLAGVEDYVRNIREIAYLDIYDKSGTTLLSSYVNDKLETSALEVLSAHNFTSRTSAMSAGGQTAFDRQLKEQNIVRIIRPVAISALQLQDSEHIDLNRPQNDQVTAIGYIELGVDYSLYRANLFENIIKASAYILVMFMLALVFGRVLIKKALRPLLELREPLEKLARGDTDVWVKRGGDIEIVAISDALNSTIDAIKGRDAELRRLADFDPLTGLYNKRSFNILFEKECSRIVDQHDTGALLFIDLDQFKHVNDNLGHAAGDRLLVEIAGLLKKSLRVKDIVSRLGGDEFAVLVSSINKDSVIELAQAILDEVGNFLHVEAGKTFTVGCSIGIALIEDGQYRPEDIFSHADIACYTAKSRGRNRYHLYKPAHVDKNKFDIGWSQRITRALSDNNFQLNFQPIITAGKQQVTAYEVLVRLVDNDSTVLPGSFMPVAERFGLAAEIDYCVIGKAVETIKHEQTKENHPRLHINLSAQIVASSDFVERLLLLTPDPAIIDRLVFEIPEQTILMNISSVSARLTKLKSLGFNLIIDRFGSGLNSFTYLRHIPVDCVKVSGELVQRMVEDDVDRAMVQSIIIMAIACDKAVIASHVQCKKTMEMLESLGVDYLQGDFIAEPQHNFTAVEESAYALAGGLSILPTA